MALAAKWISADSHVCEVPATWERARHTHGDLAPKIVGTDHGTFLIVEGWTDHPKTLRSQDRAMLDDANVGARAFVEEITHDYIGLALGKRGQVARLTRESWRGSTGSFTGTGSSEAEDFMKTFRQEDYPGPGSDPAARLEDQDADNVAAEILFPSFLCRLYAISATNEPFLRDIAHSYNEWLIDFAGHDPKRLIAQPVLSVLNPQGAAEDLRKYAARGVKACAIASSVPLGTSYGDPRFDPIWAAADECDMRAVDAPEHGRVEAPVLESGRARRHRPAERAAEPAPVHGAAAGDHRHAVRADLRRRVRPVPEPCASSPPNSMSAGSRTSINAGSPSRRGWDCSWHRASISPATSGSPSRTTAPAASSRPHCSASTTSCGRVTTRTRRRPGRTRRSDLERQFDGISDEVRAKITYENVIDFYRLDPSVVAA